jgi:hypothetical protein
LTGVCFGVRLIFMNRCIIIIVPAVLTGFMRWHKVKGTVCLGGGTT